MRGCVVPPRVAPRACGAADMRVSVRGDRSIIPHIAQMIRRRPSRKAGQKEIWCIPLEKTAWAAAQGLQSARLHSWSLAQRSWRAANPEGPRKDTISPNKAAAACAASRPNILVAGAPHLVLAERNRGC